MDREDKISLIFYVVLLVILILFPTWLDLVFNYL